MVDRTRESWKSYCAMSSTQLSRLDCTCIKGLLASVIGRTNQPPQFEKTTCPRLKGQSMKTQCLHETFPRTTVDREAFLTFLLEGPMRKYLTLKRAKSDAKTGSRPKWHPTSNNSCMHACMHGRTDGRMDGWTHGRIRASGALLVAKRKTSLPATRDNQAEGC